MPVQERSRSLALVYSGMYTGSILGLALSPHMIEVRCPSRVNVKCTCAEEQWEFCFRHHVSKAGQTHA